MGPDLSLKILFVAPYAPTRIRTRPFHLIKALVEEGHRVSLATLYTSDEEAGAIQTLAQGLDSVLAEKIHVSRSLWNCALALPCRYPLQSRYSWSPRLAHRVAQHVERNSLDVIHVEHLRGARYGLLLKSFRNYPSAERPPVVWDSVDCISSLFRQAAEGSLAGRFRLAAKLDLRRTEKYEAFLASHFERVLVTSENDRRDLLKLVRDRHGSIEGIEERIRVIPNGVDLTYFSPPVEPREPHVIVVSGKMSYHANVTAVVHLVAKVMPKVWSQLPDVRLWIVGKDPPVEVRRLGVPWSDARAAGQGPGEAQESRVLVTGTVDDIRPFLRRATIAVAPALYGVGIQNKVLEALACGLPVVATPEAVSALNVRSGRELIITRDEDGMANSLIALLRNSHLRSDLGVEGRLFVERRHEWRSVARDLTQVYLDAVDRSMAYVANRSVQ